MMRYNQKVNNIPEIRRKTHDKYFKYIFGCVAVNKKSIFGMKKVIKYTKH